MAEYFPEVKSVKYEGPDSKNPLAFRHYNPDEIVLGKTMAEPWVGQLYITGVDVQTQRWFFSRDLWKIFMGAVGTNPPYAGFDLLRSQDPGS